MPAVVTFWWFPNEEESFLSFLERTGDVMALPFLGAPKKDDLHPIPLRDYIFQRDPDQLFLLLAEHMQEAVIQPVEVPEGNQLVTRYRVIDADSCVIGCDRGKKHGPNKLSPSNLYAYWEYPNSSGTGMLRKPDGFVRWAKKVFNWVNKATPEWHQYRNYRVSKQVKDAILNGSLEIMTY